MVRKNRRRNRGGEAGLSGVAASSGRGPPVANGAPRPQRIASKGTKRIGRRGLPYPGVLSPQGTVQIPEMTHKMTEGDKTFLVNFLDPCDERVGPSSLSKIPDGTLENSGINGFREQFNVEVPFDLPSGANIVGGGPVWTLVVLRLPTIRTALYLIAYRGRSDLSVSDQNRIVDFYNDGSVGVYPEFTSVTDDIKMSAVVFSLLRAFPNLRDLMLQVRIAKTGITTYHNAPDLFNQGMIICGQWNLDQATKASTQATGTASTTVEIPTTVIFQSVGTPSVNIPQLVEWGLPEGRTQGMFLVYNDIRTSWSGSTEPLSAVEAGFTGTVGFTNSTQRLAFGITDDLVLSASGTETAGGPGGNITLTIAVVAPDGSTRSTNTQLSWTNSTTLNLVSSISYEISALTGVGTGVDVILPPLDQQTIIQSSPKSVTMPSKQFNGAYSVGRVWEPVLNMQEVDNQGVIRWRRRQAISTPSSRLLASGDLLDLNFGTIVQVHAGLAYAASVTIKIVMDIEFVAGEGSPWQAQMQVCHNVDTQVIAMARAIAMEQPFAFPQTYNSLGMLFDSLEKVLEKVPIIGNVVPIVSHLARSFFGDKEDGGNSKNVSKPPQQLSEILSSLLQKLGLGN